MGLLGGNKTKPEISPEQLKEKKDAYVKAKAEYEEASGEKKAADAKKLRCGKYQTKEDSPRPFVYVPEGFELNEQGAIGQVLEALGVKEALGGVAPSMVLRVSKATMPRVHETAAVRQTLALSDLKKYRDTKNELPSELENLFRDVDKKGKKIEVEKVKRAVVLITLEEAQREFGDEILVSLPSADALTEENLKEGALVRLGNKLFKIVDEQCQGASHQIFKAVDKAGKSTDVKRSVVLSVLTPEEAERKSNYREVQAEHKIDPEVKLYPATEPPGNGHPPSNTREAANDGQESRRFEEGTLFTHRSDLFKIVDDDAIDVARAKLRGKTDSLMRAVLHCCKEAHAIVRFNHARKDNPQLDLFDDARGAVLLGTFVKDDWKNKPIETNECSRVWKESTVEPIKLDYNDDTPDAPHRNLTHTLIFADKRKQEDFDQLLAGAVTEGVMLVGGTPNAFVRAIDALRDGKPLFVFDGTGGAAALFAAMFREHQRTDEIKRLSKKKDKKDDGSTLLNFGARKDRRLEFLETSSKDGLHGWSGPSAQEAFCIAQNWKKYGDPENETIKEIFGPKEMSEKDKSTLTKLSDAQSNNQTMSNEQKKILKKLSDAARVEKQKVKDLSVLKALVAAMRLHDWKTWPSEKVLQVSPREQVLQAIATENAWPPVACDKSILVVPTMTMEPKDLQDKLTRIMSGVEDLSELGGTESERDLLKSAWAQWAVYMDNAASQAWNARWLNIPVIILTLLAVLCSTWESFLQLRAGRGRRKHTGKDVKKPEPLLTVLHVLITVFPLLVALFVGLNALFQPILKWAALKLAARRVESEIYKFRLRVGDYQLRRDLHSQAFDTAAAEDGKDDGDVTRLQADKQTPRARFSEQLNEIWDAVQSSEVGTHGALHSKALHSKSFADRFLSNKLPKVTDDQFLEIKVKIKKEMDYEPSRLTMISGTDNDKDKDAKEDYLSPLDGQQYLHYRVYPMLGQRLSKAQTVSWLLNVLLVGVLFCSFLAGVFGAFNAPLLVPAVFAVSAAFVATKEFTLWPQTRRANNGTITELKNLDVWWSGLKLIQRRQHAYKEQLVTLAEKQLQFEIATISQLAIKYDKERSKKMEEEVAAAEEERKKSKSKKTPSEESQKKPPSSA